MVAHIFRFNPLASSLTAWVRADFSNELSGRLAQLLLTPCALAVVGPVPTHNETTAIAVDTFKAQDRTFSAANKVETFLKPRLSVICILPLRRSSQASSSCLRRVREFHWLQLRTASISVHLISVGDREVPSTRACRSDRRGLMMNLVPLSGAIAGFNGYWEECSKCNRGFSAR